MKNFGERLLSWNFKKISLIFVAVAAAVGIIGGALLYTSFRPRMDGWRDQVVEYRQQEADRYEQGRTGEYPRARGEYWGRGCSGMGRHRGYGYSQYARGARHETIRELAGSMGLTSADRALLVGVGVSTVILGLTLRILLALWIAQKAAKSGANPVLWGLLTLVFRLWAVLGFFIYRSFLNRCPRCGIDQRNESHYCGNCGTPLQTPCKNCGTQMGMKDQYCGNCGQSRD